MKTVSNFEASARALVDLLGRIAPEQWDSPGLGVWTVRSLAGHASRAILTVEQYLAKPAPDAVDHADAESYYRSAAAGGIDHDEVAQRGIAAGEALGTHPADAVREMLAHTLARLAAEPATRNVLVVGGRSIHLDEYLRTRVLELVVHTIDLSRATGIPHGLTPLAVEEAVTLASRVASRQGAGEDLLLAMTGRVTLPEGFSVV
ncbi:MAG: maleylpyruvate isomerase N-terminal domain-containing protein [Terrimesophilobacter sp.]